MSRAKPTMLIILDGFGISSEKKYNACYQAKTPHFDNWRNKHFYTTLQAAGKFVGLPVNYNGNSEVGHFTLGAGRIVPQTVTILNTNLETKNLQINSILINILKKFNKDKRVHLMGLASDGNIHSNLHHAQALIATLHHHNISKILFHAFLDGRDTPPQSALNYLEIIEKDLDKLQCGKIASIHGRYFALDRNRNWDRTQKTFEILTKQQESYTPYQDYIKKSYNNEITDEFIEPQACASDHAIQNGDGIIFFNFRPDRAIQLTQKLLTLETSFFITPINYHTSLPTTPLISATHVDETLLETLSLHKKNIFTIAETEKYAHVTYFFNGHKDIRLATEQRTLVPSSTKLHPHEDPVMQAHKITEEVLQSLQTKSYDFYLINYANADMVGHSGNLPATIAAIECLDEQLSQLYQEVVIKQKGTIYITADHGNAETMFNEVNNQPCTSHTNNPVPFYMLTLKKIKKPNLQSLADVAPYILQNMNIPIPQKMSGTFLTEI